MIKQTPNLKKPAATGMRKSTKPRPQFNVINDITATPWTDFNMLIYGSPGCGKTTLAATAVEVPEMRDVLLLDNDGGSRVVKGKERFKGLEVVTTIGCDTKNMHEIFRWMSNDPRTKTSTREVLKSLGDPKRFRTIIFDNLGSFHWATLKNVLETLDRNRPDTETPSIADYGTARARIRNLLEKFAQHSVETGTTFIFTAHVEMDRTEYELVNKMRPAIPGKLGFEIPGDLAIVGYMEVTSARKQLGKSNKDEGGKRIVHFDPRANAKIEAKDQSEKLGISMPDPSMAKIYKLLRG